MKQMLINLAYSINNKLTKHVDKVLHATVSYALTYTLADKANANLAVGVAILVGLAKEFFDLYVKKSKFSVGDIIADVLGIAIAFLIVGV